MLILIQLIGLILSLSIEPMELFDFNPDCDLTNWYILDDGVMGGRSQGNFEINTQGHGSFFGDVSLKNNGGFSSVRYNLTKQDITGYKFCNILLKGDGKSYQFRVKTDQYDRHSYIYHFETSGEWETISIPLATMYPGFRGRKLNMPNYPIKQLAELSFMIGNKKAEPFKLELDSIILE